MDQQKLSALYQRHKALLFTVANRILDNPHEAEEVVHDVFLTAAEHLEKLPQPDHPKTRAFLLTIAQHKAINLYRRKQRHPQAPLPPELPDPAELEAQTDHSLTRCILRLPPQYRQLILLRYAQGFSPRETAALLGISPAAAYKLEQRAKAKLKILCQEEGLDP